MEEAEQGNQLQNLILRPVYLRAVNAIVQPELQIPCSQYFLREWLPRLGALRWLLVLALRHLCGHRQPDGSGRGEFNRSQLAGMLGVHEVTISRVLTTTRSKLQPGWRVLQPDSEADSQTAFLGRFVPRLRYRYERDPSTGVSRRVGYVIDVLMDDPLVPEHEARLALVLAQQMVADIDEFSPDQELTAAAYSPPAQVLAPSTERIVISQASPTYQPATVAPTSKAQGATSTARVTYQEAPAILVTSTQTVISPPGLQGLCGSSPTLKKRKAPGLTLPNSFNYNGISVPLNITDKREIRKRLTPLVDYVQALLADDHSTGMFFSTSTQLYPDHLGLFVSAFEQALASTAGHSHLNKGAVFVNTLKRLAAERHVPLKLGRKLEEGAVPVANAELGAEGPETTETVAARRRPSFYVAGVGMSSLQIWQSTLDELRRLRPRVDHDEWLRNCYLGKVDAESVIVVAPNGFTRDWVADKLQQPLRTALRRVLGQSVALRLDVAGEPQVKRR